MNITQTETARYLKEIARRKQEPDLLAMEDFAQGRFIPILQKEAGEVLRFFVAWQAPQRILELGCAIGYSAILMARAAGPRVHIDTLEREDALCDLAEAFIAERELSEQITVHRGEIDELLPTLSGPYDFVFMDAGKSHYSEYLKKVLPLLSPQGVILCDNVLVRGLVAAQGTYRKHSTAILSMRSFIEEASFMARFTTAILPVGDGMLIMKDKEDPDEARS
ncbi:O-methyltransferase family protein [Clostridiaceae bacterium JG1575]|nr:O-methyltransferase family protein [Clostridiaceae bacterium JG1575]